LPADGTSPTYIPLYIYDTANEVKNRMKCLNSGERISKNLNPSIVQRLIKMLNENNPFVKKFKMARDRLHDYGDKEFIIRIVSAKEGDSVQYNLPTTDELAMLVVGDFSLNTFKCDIIIKTHNNELKHISALHLAFLALQYPLLFPYGECGFQVGVLYIGVVNTNRK
jgi:hypothetical protein